MIDEAYAGLFQNADTLNTFMKGHSKRTTYYLLMLDVVSLKERKLRENYFEDKTKNVRCVSAH